MKIAPLLFASATALETASTAHNLLSAVGHRNATKMEALVQGLVEESISEPGWKFDPDVVAALNAIRDMFVKNIQKALREAHKVDQEHMNCFTQECFGKCTAEYQTTMRETCKPFEKECNDYQHEHFVCRHEVHGLYTHMAQSCSALHSFIESWKDFDCTPESCLCPDLTYCHKKPGEVVQGDDYVGGGNTDECQPEAGECTGSYGGWLLTQLRMFEREYGIYDNLYNECRSSYHAFLTADLKCDKVQKNFETCRCNWRTCHHSACNNDYELCHGDCWSKYENHVREKECLEKDRKIDWSATKKIECYVDILLHDYTKEELVTKCGDENCINKAREEDYQHCQTICLEVDHDGEWPTVEMHADGTSAVSGHAARKRFVQDGEESDYLLGDGEFECDSNGPQVVFTKHRGGELSREEEKRCTEHLDIDFQVPACLTCEKPPDPVCDAAFHQVHYSQFDDLSQIKVNGETHDFKDSSNYCKAKNQNCFDDVKIGSSSDGHIIKEITVSEHSNAWAFNRCPCKECSEMKGFPRYPPNVMECGLGAHSVGPRMDDSSTDY